MNFIEPIYQQLLLNKDINLIKWPNGNYSTGQSLLDLIKQYQEILPESKEYILLAKAFDEDTLGVILAGIGNGNPIIIYPKSNSIKSNISFLKSLNVKHAFVNNFILKIILKWNSISALESKNRALSNIEIQDVKSDFPALISFSSGSTGINKSIARSHQLLTEQVKAIHSTFNNWSNSTDFPLFANILLYNLSIGKKTIIPSISKFDLNYLNPDDIISQLIKEDIDTITGNEFYFESICNKLLLQHKTVNTVKGIGIGGSPISNELIIKLKECFPNAIIQIIYGTTEAEPISIKIVEDIVTSNELGYNVGSIHPLIELKINKTHSAFINNNEVNVGEILVKGNHVAIHQQNEYLHTCDFGYTWNNELYLTARSGNTENINGIQHLQIEHTLFKYYKHKIAVIIRDGFLNIYTEKKISKDEIEQHLFVIFKIKFPIKLIVKQIPKDPRHLSKVLYHKI